MGLWYDVSPFCMIYPKYFNSEYRFPPKKKNSTKLPLMLMYELFNKWQCRLWRFEK